MVDKPPMAQSARDRMMFKRLTNPAQPERPLYVLYEGDNLLRELATRRDEIVSGGEVQHVRVKHKRIRVVDSKKVLTKGEEPGMQTPKSSTPRGSLYPMDEDSSEGEEVEVPKSLTLSTVKTVQPAEEPMDEGLTQEEEKDEDFFRGDTICAWCDDGGDLVMCDGPCMRGFHMERDCNPLKVPEDLKAAILNSKYPFECPNCWSRTHRCFKCCKEFKMDVTSTVPLLAKCDFVDCGRFYCIKCQDQITKQLQKNFETPIKTGPAFICPLHICAACGTWEDTIKDPLFPCRRCPKALHLNCMSKKVANDPTRIWRALVDKDGKLLKNTQVSQNFFYCTRHQTQNTMQGPVQECPMFSDKIWRRWRKTYALKFRCLESSTPFLPDRSATQTEDLTVALMALNSRATQTLTLQTDAYKVAQKKRMRTAHYANEGEMIEALVAVIHKGQEKNVDHCKQLRALVDLSLDRVSLDEVESELTSVYPYNRRHHIKLTDDRLDFFIHRMECATTDALLKNDRGYETMVKQMQSALKAMRVSCAPFLQPTYTSYGRHFTKTSILKHIVHHVIKYMKPNDLVVDFSCGTNEFLGILVDFCKKSSLRVRIKAFDLFTPFRMDGFVRKNWFDVTRVDLDKGDNLIVGLNPPFGVNAYLANQFILHAAKFKPRMMMLICPPETAIPDNYYIVREDPDLCKDKAFYIPGLRADQGNDIPPRFRVLQRKAS